MLFRQLDVQFCSLENSDDKRKLAIVNLCDYPSCKWELFSSDNTVSRGFIQQTDENGLTIENNGLLFNNNPQSHYYDDSRFENLEIGNLRDDNNTRVYERIFSKKSSETASPNLSFWIDTNEKYFLTITPNNGKTLFSFIEYESQSKCPQDGHCDSCLSTHDNKREDESHLNSELYVLMKKRESERCKQSKESGHHEYNSQGGTHTYKETSPYNVPPNSPDVTRLQDECYEHACDEDECYEDDKFEDEDENVECIITLYPEDIVNMMYPQSVKSIYYNDQSNEFQSNELHELRELHESNNDEKFLSNSATNDSESSESGNDNKQDLEYFFSNRDSLLKSILNEIEKRRLRKLAKIGRH